MQGVLTVLVNGFEIPLGVTGTNMTGTGWYNILTLGYPGRRVRHELHGLERQPAGDPYGSMAYLSVVVPNQINNGNSLPTVQVLAQGLLVPVYGSDGTLRVGSVFEQSRLDPAGYSCGAADGASQKSICPASRPRRPTAMNRSIPPTSTETRSSIPRFQCNLVLQKRRSAGDVIRGVRNTARLYLTYGPGGVLQLAGGEYGGAAAAHARSTDVTAWRH